MLMQNLTQTIFKWLEKIDFYGFSSCCFLYLFGLQLGCFGSTAFKCLVFSPHQKKSCILNCSNSIKFHLDVLWFGGGVGIWCVESACLGVFQKPLLIFMLGSAYKVEKVVLIFSLLCFNSVANILEDGMGSADPWHVWELLVFILSLRFTVRVWIALWRPCPLNLGSMESLNFPKLYMCDFYKIALKSTHKSVLYGLREHSMLMLTG